MKAFLIIILIFAVIFYIGSRFYFDKKIQDKGIESLATIIAARQKSANEGGSINAAFHISFLNEKNEQEELSFDETIPQMYASQVQPGNRIAIKYLRGSGKVRVIFIFKKTI